MSITYPPEMLPIADDEAEVVVCDSGVDFQARKSCLVELARQERGDEFAALVDRIREPTDAELERMKARAAELRQR